MTIDGTAAPGAWGDRPQGMSWTRSVQSIWKTWLLTRILVIGAAAVSSAVVDEPLSRSVRLWDAGWFLHIAEHGYGDRPESPEFYPLYPALLRAGGDALGGHPVLAGFLLSFPTTLCAFTLLAALASSNVGEEQSARAVAYLAVFPTAFFLQALYSEGLFLVFAVGAFLAAERRRFLPAAGLAGAAMLTRPLGVAVLAGLVLFALREPGPRAALARISVAPLVFALYPLILVLDGRAPLVFTSAVSHWRDTSLEGAIRSPYLAAKAAWTGLRDLTGGYDYVALLNVTAFGALVAFACLSVVAWRRLGAPYGAYCLLSLAMPVAAPAAPWPLASMQRYVLTVFPCFIVLGALPIGRRWHRVLLALSAALLILLIVYWTQGKFVA
jgi:hypothetical protein